MSVKRGCREFWPQIPPANGLFSLACPTRCSLPFLLLFRLTCYYYRGAYSPLAVSPSLHRRRTARHPPETRFPLVLQNLHRYFFYIAAIISLINTWDAIKAMHSPSGFGFGLGNVILWVNVPSCGPTPSRATCCRHVMGGRLGTSPNTSRAVLDVDQDQQAQHPIQGVRMDHPRQPDVHRLLHHAGGSGAISDLRFIWLTSQHTLPSSRSEVPMVEVRRHQYDVVVIGAGGSGLRVYRGPPARAAEGGRRYQVAVRRGPTVMAEGRLRRGDGQRQPKRQLEGPLRRRHHARRQVPQQLADGRTARAGGTRPGVGVGDLRRAVRPDQGRPDQPAQLRRAHLPRLAHVGDRTGLEIIRTLQQKIVSLQQEDKAELGDTRPDQGLPRVRDHRTHQGRGPDRRRVRLLARDRQVHPFRLPAIVLHRRHRASRSRCPSNPGSALATATPWRCGRAPPDQHGVHPVPPDRHGLAAVGEGHPRHRGRSGGDGGC